MKKSIWIFICFLSLSFTLSAQNTVSGTVMTADGDPLIGVNIVEVGTTNGTISDIDGAYTLQVGNNAQIEYSYTGYQNQILNVDGRGSINVVLVEGEYLDEVVVTALGIEKQKRALPYSVTELEGSSLATAKEVNVGNALAGKIAGVNVSKPATGAGGSSRIVIRGNNNISGNNTPLIVVDGVPINNQNLGSAGMWGGQDWGDGLSSVNSDDIETMTVLKGNTAGALYGYRADNGVILITTKKGKKGRIGVDFNSNYQYESIIDNYDFQHEYGHGRDGVKPTTVDEALQYGLYAYGEKLDGSSVMQFDGVSRPYSDQGNNLNKFYRGGSTWTNSIGLSGGSDNAVYRFSFTDLQNKGIMPNSGLNRKTFTTNTSASLGRFSASVSGSYVIEGVNNRPSLSDSPGNANYTAWSLPASINIEDLRGSEDKLGANEAGTELQFNDNIYVTNPYWAAYQFERNSDKNRVFGNATLGYELIDGLTIRGRAGIDRFVDFRRNITPYGTAYSSLGQGSERNRTVQEVNLEATLNYVQNYNDQFGIDILLGGNSQRNSDQTLGTSGSQYSIPFLHSINNLAQQSLTYGYSQSRVNSLFGSVQFSYNQSIYVTVTGRNDWFSTLTNPDENLESSNSIFYPSVGIAYDLANGLNLTNIFDFAKLRASWAQVGGATSPYQLGLTYRVIGQGHEGQALGGVSNGSIPPIDLVPSTNTEFEIGTDFRMFTGRFHADLAYYSRETLDGILSASISPTSGYGSKVINVGKVTNKGFEALLEITPVKKPKFEWVFGFNFAHNNNEVVSLLTETQDDEEEIRLEESRTRNAYVSLIEGLPYSQVMGFAYARDASGNIMVDDDGLPVQGEYQAFGTGVHPTTYGINNSFNFGDFTASFLIDIKSGAVIYGATNAFGYTRGLHKATLEGRETGIGNVAPADVENYYQRIAGSISEEFIQDASFAKLREVIIGYRFPASLVGNSVLKGARLSFAARNLFILSKHTDNIDPESTYSVGNGQGLEMFGVPTTRTYGLNLNLQF